MDVDIISFSFRKYICTCVAESVCQQITCYWPWRNMICDLILMMEAVQYIPKLFEKQSWDVSSLK